MRAFALPIVLLGALVLLAGGIISRFDLEPVRPFIESGLAYSLGIPVRVKKISLQKKLPPALNLDGLEFLEAEGGNPWLQTDRAAAEIDLGAFIKRQLRFKNIFLGTAHLRIKRRKDGTWNFSPRPPKFFVPALIFKKGTLEYLDESASPFFAFHLNFEGVLEQRAAGLKLKGMAHFESEDASQMLFEADYDSRRQGGVLFELKDVASGLWNVQGELRLWEQGDSRFKVAIETRGFDLAKMIPPDRSRGQESITGLITLRLEGYGEGTHPDRIKRTLVLDGAIDLRDGIFHHLNFLKEALAGLSPMPAFSGLLPVKLPGSAGELFQGEDLPFEMLRAGIHMDQGRIELQEALASHEAYLIEGEGSWAPFDRNVDFGGKLVLLEGLSQTLTTQAREWIPLQNAQGRIMIPFKYRGLLPGASIYPDLEYVAAQFFQKKGESKKS